MTKPIIAIDVDEVLSNTVVDFVAYSNKHFGTRLTVDDYDEHWGRMWQIDEAETERRAVAWRASGVISKHNHNVGAGDILRHLSSDYDLVVTTSRRATMRDETTTWLHEHFGDVFKEIYYTGIYDQAINDASFAVTKADLYRQIGADYAIDDQLKHCLAADDIGASAILFGNYPWNQHDSLPLGITRCANWHEVGAYFDGRA